MLHIVLLILRSTSPSVYIAFPQISATDGCGLIGSVYTQKILGFAPGELSTAVINASAAISALTPQYFPFDFRYALCPPASLEAMDHISFVGQQGMIWKPAIHRESCGMMLIAV